MFLGWPGVCQFSSHCAWLGMQLGPAVRRFAKLQCFRQNPIKKVPSPAGSLRQERYVVLDSGDVVPVAQVRSDLAEPELPEGHPR